MNDGLANLPATLGDVLFAKSPPKVDEAEWANLIQAIADGDEQALHTLYGVSHHPIFALALHITAHREAAEEVTRDVFYDAWLHARSYDPENRTVLAWIMGLARLRARSRARLDATKKTGDVSERKDQANWRDIDVSFLASGDRRFLLPIAPLQDLLGHRIANDTDIRPDHKVWPKLEWERVASGIECRLLASDAKRARVSMLVRLEPGASYPAHRHAGTEELHLLNGELWIDGHKLLPGDYYCAPLGTIDFRVWSETGCTCLLVTSTKDILR